MIYYRFMHNIKKIIFLTLVQANLFFSANAYNSYQESSPCVVDGVDLQEIVQYISIRDDSSRFRVCREIQSYKCKIMPGDYSQMSKEGCMEARMKNFVPEWFHKNQSINVKNIMYYIRLCSGGYIFLKNGCNYTVFTDTHLPNEFHKLIILPITIPSLFRDSSF